MKMCLIHQKNMKNVGQVIAELQKLDPETPVEAESFPELNKPLLTIWEDEYTKKISMQLGW